MTYFSFLGNGTHHFHMMIIFLFLMSGCSSCGTDAPPPKPLPKNYIIILMDDFTSTRKGFERLDTDRIKNTIEPFRKENLPLTIYAVHVMDRRWNPLACTIERYFHELDRAMPDYPKRKKESAKLDSLNNANVEIFLTQFQERFTKFTINSETDFSYIETKLRAIARILSHHDENTTLIACLSTDMIQHSKGENARPVSEPTIKLLNEVLAAHPKVQLYLISDDNFTGTPTDNLQVTDILGSWTQFQGIIENQIFNHF